METFLEDSVTINFVQMKTFWEDSVMICEVRTFLEDLFGYYLVAVNFVK